MPQNEVNIKHQLSTYHNICHKQALFGYTVNLLAYAFQGSNPCPTTIQQVMGTQP